MHNRRKNKSTYSFSLTILMVLLVLNLKVAAQQSFTFTQYMDNPVPYNPAFAVRDTESGSLYSSVRKQWLGIHGAPTTFLLNGSIKFPTIDGAAGFVLMDDQLAVEQNLELNLYFAKSIQIGETQRLAVSINAGVRQYKTNFASLDENDPVTKNDINELRPNVGFGVMLYSNRYYLGVSLPELTLRTLGTAGAHGTADFRSNFYFTGGYSAVFDDDFSLKPSALLSYTKGLPLAVAAAAMLELKNSVGFGFSYRSTNEAAGILSINWGQYHIGYSYQFGISNNTIGGFGNATHELLFAVRFGKPAEK